MPPQKVLIIGSGLTGALCSSYLRNALPLASIIVWDKARGAGGRMTTIRTDRGHKADLGAQYISTSAEALEMFSTEYQPLITKGIISKLTAPVEEMKQFPSDVVHFVAPDGMGSIVKNLLNGSQVFYNRHVNSILVENDRYKVTSQDGSSEDCDVLISTIPVPQFLNLSGANHVLDEASRSRLEQVKYSTRFVLVWFYDGNAPKPGWGSKYLDDPVFRFVSIDNVKRGQTDGPVAVVFHSSVQYGEKHKLKSKTDLEEELNVSAKRLFPDWPQPSTTRPHKWLYSQVIQPCPDADGCLILGKTPKLVLAGDAFTESNFNGCVQSARTAVQAIINS